MLRPFASEAIDGSRATTPGVRSEAGETLVEVLLALIILALASVALLTAFGTDISASAEHRRLSSFDTVLASSISMTTSVVQQQYAAVFGACSPLSAYPSSTVLTSALDVPGYTAAIAPAGSQPAVEYLDGNSFSATCTSGTSGDVGNPQLINVVVTNTATGYSQDNTVVRRRPHPGSGERCQGHDRDAADVHHAARGRLGRHPVLHPAGARGPGRQRPHRHHRPLADHVDASSTAVAPTERRCPTRALVWRPRESWCTPGAASTRSATATG